jgi:[methyl-Co(III) methanol-specific corrinoid protein]:coenzyme M methyltransferase
MLKKKMTSSERVTAALAGDDFDVYPVINPTSIATHDLMERTRVFCPSLFSNPMEMAELAAAGHEYFGFDSVQPYLSSYLEASALGVQIDFNTYLPEIIKQPYNSIDDINIPQSFLHKKEFQQLLKAIEILKKKFKGRVPIIGKVVGPWTLAAYLFGLENLVMGTILEPLKLKKLLDELAVIPMKFAEAQFDTGANMVTWLDFITANLVSADVYKEFLLPIHKKAAELQKMGPLILHICGNVMDRFMHIIETRFRIVHMHSKNDIAAAIKQAKSRITITGCINVPVTLYNGNPDIIQAEVEANVKSGVRLISPECVLPAGISGNSVKCLVESAHRLKVKKLD